MKPALRKIFALSASAALLASLSACGGATTMTTRRRPTRSRAPRSMSPSWGRPTCTPTCWATTTTSWPRTRAMAWTARPR
ncbi:hypothetical protein WJ968_10325 [Achromobacter xylosoxidans]